MLKALLRFVMKALFRVELRGDPSVFVNEKTLIVANHESFIDGLLMGLMLPVDAVFVIHSQIAARPFFRCLLRFIPHLSVDSTSPLAMKQIVKLVDTGQPVVIFPRPCRPSSPQTAGAPTSPCRSNRKPGGSPHA